MTLSMKRCPPRVWDKVIINRATRVGFVSLDRVDLISIFKLRASVMKSPPKFLRGAYRSAIRVALTEADQGIAAGDEVRLCRAWKLLVLLPRMLLHKPARGRLIPKEKLKERFNFSPREGGRIFLAQAHSATKHHQRLPAVGGEGTKAILWRNGLIGLLI